MQQARQLLETGDLKVEEVAKMVGYQNRSAFALRFAASLASIPASIGEWAKLALRDRNINEPGGSYSPEVTRIGYDLEHRFSDNWSLRNTFLFTNRRFESNAYFISSLKPDNRTALRGFADSELRNNAYALTTNILGQFLTGSIRYQLLVGVDLNRNDEFQSEVSIGTAAPLDLFNLVYGQLRGPQTFAIDSATLTDTLGIYVQD